MIDFVVHGNKWVFATLFGGSVLVLGFILTCWAMWRPREHEAKAAGEDITGIRSFFTWLVGIMPWVIILSIVGMVGFSIVHTVSAALRTPNW